MDEPVPAASGQRRPWLAPLLVAAAATLLAALAWWQFLQAPDHLWWSLSHDRNTHYLLGLNLALDLRNLDLVRLVVDLEDTKVWPPLHGALVAVVLALAGPDYRLAVLPSLAGWVATAVFGFLAARRAAGQPYGNWAGLLAAVFILASPAHRAFATDTMLESLGACLTLGVLYFYLAAVQSPSKGAAAGLGLSLTLLFLEKHNYWLLVVLAIGATELLGRHRVWRRLLVEALSQFRWREALRNQLRSPLTYLLLLILAVIAVIGLSGGTSLTVGQRTISVRSLHNPILAAYVLVFLKLAGWWRRSGREWLGRQDSRLRQLAYWHAWPVAIWFLWPQKLGYFLWFISPANANENANALGLLHGLGLYLRSLAQDYHQHVALFGLVLALAVVAAALVRRLPRGSVIVLATLVICFLMTVGHPNHKGRYLHSWIAASWVAAGVGLAGLMRWRKLPGGPPLRRLVAAGAVAGLAALQLPPPPHSRPPLGGGVLPQRASTLELARCYLSELEQARHVVILSNLPLKQFAAWTFRETFGGSKRLETELRNFSAPDAPRAALFRNWCATTDCDACVFLEFPRGSCFFERAVCDEYDEVPEWLRQQTRFQLTRTWELPERGCRIHLWSRRGTHLN